MSGYPPTKATKTGSGYHLELELDPVRGTSRYQHQMQNISNLKTLPVFSYCHLTFEFDNELNPLSYTTHENYYAKTSQGVGSNCEGRITTTFSWDGQAEIPTLGETLTYPEE